MRSCITMFLFRKRKREFDESMDHYRKMFKQRIEKKMQEMDGAFMSIVATTLSNLTVKKTKKRSKDVQRDQTWWADARGKSLEKMCTRSYDQVIFFLIF